MSKSRRHKAIAASRTRGGEDEVLNELIQTANLLLEKCDIEEVVETGSTEFKNSLKSITRLYKRELKLIQKTEKDIIK